MQLLTIGKCRWSVSAAYVSLLLTVFLPVTLVYPARAQADISQMRSLYSTEKVIGELEIVATFNGPMPTGVTVSESGRIFVNFPRWGDDVPFTVAEVVDGEAIPYPNLEINTPNGIAADRFLSVQSVVIAPNNLLWVLDTGRIEFEAPPEGGPKLVAIDLATNNIVQTIELPETVALPTTYLNDVRFDLRRGEAGMAYITDSSFVGDNGIIVVDLASGRSWRRLHQHVSTLPEPNFIPIVEGQALLNRPEPGVASPMTVGADGIALDAAGERLFYRPLSGRRLYSVELDALSDEGIPDESVVATVEDYGDLGFASDGLEADAKGRIYLTNYEDNGIVVFQPDQTLETLVHNPSALWPDTLSLAQDGYLYFTANQLHRQPGFNNGEDLREKPYLLYRVRVSANPVLLR